MENCNTAEVPYGDREEYWRYAISNAFVPLESTFSGQDREGSLTTGKWGALRLSQVSCSAQDVIRTQKRSGNYPDDRILLSIIRRGKTAVVQAGNYAQLQQGQFSLYDTRHPYELHLHSETDQHVVQIPRDDLRQKLGRIEPFVAHAFGRHHALMPYLQMFLNHLMTQPENIDPRHAAVLYEQFFELFTTIMSDECSVNLKGGSTQQGLLFRIKIMVGQRLAESTLSATDIAQSFGITPRYLNMLLKNDGTSFGRYLLDQRLIKTTHMLQSPLQSSLSISHIAWRCGFNDMAYFSRAFRAKFGCSPTEFRHRHRSEG